MPDLSLLLKRSYNPRMMKRVHLIAIGGAVMHYIALMLQRKGVQVSGSDDDIFEPSAGRLKQAGLFPDKLGWYPERIDQSLDAVILGMHAKADNPELLRAKELGVTVLSFPEFIYQQCLDKHRVVIGGSHGKTTITGMVAHVLKTLGRKFDYVLGAQVDGFEFMVKLEDESPLIVIEGDEYPSSPLDPTPKFLHYHHHIGVISGIAWDHINAYPNVDVYVQQFDKFADSTPKGGSLIFTEDDDFATIVGRKEREDVQAIEYGLPKYQIRQGVTFLMHKNGEVALNVFGKHNLRNIECARQVCTRIGVKEEDFYKAISSYKGAKNRLEKVNGNPLIFRDFAHAPSKVRATVQAVREQFPDQKLIACLELHTYSSLNRHFIQEYQGSLQEADVALVYFDPHTLAIKKLPPLTNEEVIKAFGRADMSVFDSADLLFEKIKELSQSEAVILMMSSGSFNGKSLTELSGGSRN